MKTPSTIEQDIDVIRLAVYEKTKDMTPAQLTDYYKQSTEGPIRKYGFKTVASAKDLTRDFDDE